MISLIALALMSFNIPAGDADRSSQAFVVQANMSIIFRNGKLNGYHTREVIGQYEPMEALRLLLDGSDLKVTAVTPRWILLDPIRHRRAASIAPQRPCDCWPIDAELGSPWCTWRDEGTLGVDDECRKTKK